jgi:transcriptional regulator with GAF, ATPase, and Fis domain
MPERPAEAGVESSADLRARLRFETFFADLTAHVLKLPAAALPAEIDSRLAGLVEVLEVDRASIALFTPDNESLVLQHSAAKPPVPAHAKTFDFVVSLPWYAQQLREGRRLVFNFAIDELPPEAEAERRYVAESGLRSHMVLPLVAGESILGALGVASFRKPRTWPPEFLARMDLLASVFAHAVYRCRAEERITAAEELNRAILRALPSEVFVLDGDGRVVSMNESARRCVSEISPEPLGEGADYVATLAGAAGRDSPDSRRLHGGIRSVLARERPSFETTCVHPSPAGPRHHLVHVVPFDLRPGTVVVHTDVTELELTKSELERSLGEVEELKDRFEAENVLLHREVRHGHGFETIVGRSAALGRVLSQIEQVAPTDSPVLLLGETGTGKDLVARALHDRSRRRERPMVSVNCAALPPTLIESELFGYERGAFTGALQRSVGRFEIADKGTIFLDEIGELPLEVQAKLLKVLQGGEFERLGSPRTIRTDVRLIAATNRDIDREMREGRFRADLYYRLSVFPVSLPPLRDRPEDIPLLVWHFVSRKQAQLGRSIKRIPDRLMRALSTYPWPGNVRELENVIERALILTEGTTLAADPVLFVTARDGAPVAGGGTLEDVERAYIRTVLAECNWKVAGPGNAADRLGLNRSTLQFRMKKLGIERPTRERG